VLEAVWGFVWGRSVEIVAGSVQFLVCRGDDIPF
jgi:hypothetical protein